MKRQTRAAQLRALMREKPHIYFPAVYDALSASMAEKAGFEAVLVSGSSISNERLGITDIGVLSYGEYRETLTNMLHASNIPIIADVDTGFGGISTILRMVEEYERMDLAGIMLEDQTFPKRCAYFEGLTVVPEEEMYLRLKAALCARKDSDFVIMARTDAASDDTKGMDEALRRAKLYYEWGADIVYISAPPTREDFFRIGELGFPTAVCIIEGTPSEQFTAAEFAQIGITWTIFPQSLIRALIYANQQVLSALYATGSCRAYGSILCSQRERNDHAALPKYVAFEAAVTGKSDAGITHWKYF